jgi:hypothetical protein
MAAETFKFQRMVCEKCIIWTEKYKIVKQMTFCGK